MSNMKRRIVIGGSSGNPTHLEHLLLLEDFYYGERAGYFTDLFWIPCGERVDKHFFVCPHCLIKPVEFCHICSNHRIAMTEMTVGHLRQTAILPRFSIWYDDVFRENTATIVWLERLAKMYPEAELTWVTGSDSIVPLEEFGGKNEIQAKWDQGEKLWKSSRWNWLVYRRAGYPLKGVRLPKRVQVAELPPCEGISSSLIRRLIAEGQDDWERMVSMEVVEYIKRHDLYGWRKR